MTTDNPTDTLGTEARKLMAIMFTDIQGYSRLMQKDETLTLRLLDEHNSLLFPIIQKRGGTVIKTAGDSILSVYESCISAVEAGVEMQKALEEKASENPENKVLRIRIGIHLGETVFKNGDVFGNGVNIAARLQPLADPGGICFSQSVYEQLQNHYKEKIVRVGPVNLKNISDPMVIYRMQIEGDSEPVKKSNPDLETAFVEGNSSNANKPEGPDHERIKVVFGNLERKGKWIAKRSIFIKNSFGSVLLDFRDAFVEHSMIDLEVNNTFGAIEIIVPSHFNVSITGMPILGSFEGKAVSDKKGPLLKIYGKTVAGSVEVRVK